MKSIEENKLLNDLCIEFNIKLPPNLKNRKIYEEIKNFKDAENIYCIAYEMLVRTDEYNALLEEYDVFIKESSSKITNYEFTKLNELIGKMNKLGLKKTSFLGFDCDNDFDHVFKRIRQYEDIVNSPWNVRMLHKFELDSISKEDNVFYLLIKFYNDEKKLYIIKNEQFSIVNLKPQIINDIKELSKLKNKQELYKFNKALETLYIPCIDKKTKEISYKSLIGNNIYLEELDIDFLSTLKEKTEKDILIQTKSEYSNNIEFWNKYSINDIKNGLTKLIEFHLENNLIYNQDIEHMNTDKEHILNNISDFYIPCVNRFNQPYISKWEKPDSQIIKNDFVSKLEDDGVNVIIGDKGYISIQEEENIYLVQISQYIPLSILDGYFLDTLKYEDLKNIYIDTEPLFSRPRLMFDEARLTSIPINLNLSKDDLLLYIAQIKDEYNNNKNIVKNDIEYVFDLALESDLIEMPTNIKYVKDKTKSIKQLLPNTRKEFQKSLASAFYIYDLYKFFIPLFEKKIKSIIDERETKIEEIKRIANKNDTIINLKEIAERQIKNYENNNLAAQISYVVQNISEEQVEYYFTAMKEFIHGVNQKGEYNIFKKKYNSEKPEPTDPKYKNLIIGDSYIIKTNKPDLVKSLID
jgi:hypothetical protein